MLGRFCIGAFLPLLHAVVLPQAAPRGAFAPAVRARASSPLMGAVRQVTTAEFEAELQDCSSPILLDVFAVWCGPCQLMAPQLDIVRLLCPMDWPGCAHPCNICCSLADRCRVAVCAGRDRVPARRQKERPGCSPGRWLCRYRFIWFQQPAPDTCAAACAWQVAATLGDKCRVLKIDSDAEPEVADTLMVRSACY